MLGLKIEKILGDVRWNDPASFEGSTRGLPKVWRVQVFEACDWFYDFEKFLLMLAIFSPINCYC